MEKDRVEDPKDRNGTESADDENSHSAASAVRRNRKVLTGSTSRSHKHGRHGRFYSRKESVSPSSPRWPPPPEQFPATATKRSPSLPSSPYEPGRYTVSVLPGKGGTRGSL